MNNKLEPLTVDQIKKRIEFVCNGEVLNKQKSLNTKSIKIMLKGLLRGNS